MLRDLAAAIARRTEGTSPATAWAAVWEAGLVGLAVPGVGGTTVDAVLVAEQWGAGPCAAPFLGSAVWGPALLSAAGVDDVLADVVNGDVVVAPAVGADLSFGAPPAIAVDAAIASTAVAITDDGHVVSIPIGEAIESVDLTRTMRRCGSTGTALGRSLGPAARTRVEALALVLVAADLVGSAAASLADAVAYVGDRHQFGRPVGSFQAVQHMAAHAAMQVESARSALWHAAWAVDAREPEEALVHARRAKAWASETSLAVGETSLQMFGGIAFTWEMPAHRRQRRILFDRALLGDENAQYDALATRLGAVG